MEPLNQACLHSASHSEMPHGMWERGRGLLCFSLFQLLPSTGFGRMWKQTFCPLLTDHSSHTSLLICFQNTGTARTGLQELFQMDNKALGSDAQCGGEDSIPWGRGTVRGGGGAHQNPCVRMLLGLKKPLLNFCSALSPPKGDMLLLTMRSMVFMRHPY